MKYESRYKIGQAIKCMLTPEECFIKRIHFSHNKVYYDIYLSKFGTTLCEVDSVFIEPVKTNKAIDFSLPLI